jgi:nitroreductase
MNAVEAGASCAPTDPNTPSLEQQELLDLLALRYSVGPKHLAPPGPSAAQWARAADLALRAPDHGGLRPFRFVVVGDDQRTALAELFAQGAQQRGHGAEEVERARARAFNGPGLAALVARVRDDVPEVPAHEQWLCAGAALMNFMNALHVMGFGAKALSGASVSDPAVSAAFCRPGELLASWVIAGCPTRAAHPKGDAMAVPVISDWQADQA